MKFSWKTEILPLACVAVMFILAAIAWPQAPERIPTHWGITGEPDSYGGKFLGLLGIPLTMIGIYALLYFLPRFDPRRENYQKFWGKYLFFRLVILLLLACIQIVVFLWIVGVNINMSLAVFMFAGLMFILIGNYLGKLRPTWFVGIRSPWTLSSEESWNKTHRLGGRLFMIFGFGMIIVAPFRENAAYYALFAVGGVFLVFLYVYSYLVWKKDPDAAPVGTRITDRKN
jgi:uncharacterized membrane protein